MTAAPLEPMPWPRPEAIHAWADAARPGERFVYFRGFLATDRAADAVREAARGLMDAGVVTLAQTRIGPERFAYIAERRRGRP